MTPTKVFVCYGYVDFEGYGSPEVVFTDELSASKWCIECNKHSRYEIFQYKELEIK